MSSEETKLVIGIDYGTTNSGVAFAVVTDPKDDHVDINVIRRWPHGTLSDNLPSDIAYDQSGSGIPVGYGFEIPEGIQPLQWIKLLLEPAQFKGRQNTSSTERVWRAYEELQKLRKTPVDVIADYLRWLWSQIEKSLEDSGDDINTDEVVVVITLPASWSDRARDGMLRAATKAGIGSDGRILKFRVEPEAAAIFELTARAKKKQVAVGDCFIVCDAGGGTVDVVSFQVLSRQPLSLDQVVVSQGDFCGSSFINSEFESQVRSILGPDYDLLSRQVKAQIRDEFEFKIKRKYHPEKLSEYSIPVTGLEDDEDRGIKDGRLKLSEAVLRHSFETIMTQTLTLIDDQKEELIAKGLIHKLKAILLVGGFGGSEYLHTRIREEYPENEPVKVWRGDHSWTAVVQGAVQCEVANREVYAPVNTRLSRYHYGIPYSRGSFKKVHWLVHKGQDVRSSSHIEPYLLRMEDRYRLDEMEYVTIDVQLVKTDEDNVTEDFDSSLRPHVKISCKVPTDIRYSPEATLIQTDPKVWRIPAELILAMDGPLLTVRCRIKGVDVGVVDLKYHNEIDFPAHGLTAAQTMADPVRPNELRRTTEPMQVTESMRNTEPMPPIEPRRTSGPRLPSKDAADSILSNYYSAPAELPASPGPSKETSPRPGSSRKSTWFGKSKSKEQKEEKPKKEKPPKPQRIEQFQPVTRNGREMMLDLLTGEIFEAPPKYAEAAGLF